jgi:hypothetical protein
MQPGQSHLLASGSIEVSSVGKNTWPIMEMVALLMISRTVLLLAFALALTAQQPPNEHPLPPEIPEDVRLPNGKMQREEILKSDFQKTLEDSRALSKLADELKADLEKSDYNVLSVGMLKKTEDIDRLAKRIRDRLKRF